MWTAHDSRLAPQTLTRSEPNRRITRACDLGLRVRDLRLYGRAGRPALGVARIDRPERREHFANGTPSHSGHWAMSVASANPLGARYAIRSVSNFSVATIPVHACSSSGNESSGDGRNVTPSNQVDNRTQPMFVKASHEKRNTIPCSLVSAR